jgi:HlyD family secretion protein
MPRNLGWILLALVVVGGLVYGFLPQPVPVDTVLVTRGSLQVSVEAEGKTRLIDRYVLSAPVSGFAQRVRLKVGDPVERGQTLLLLEPTRSTPLDPRSQAQAAARVPAAEAAVRAAEETARAAAANAEYTLAEYKRAQSLATQGLLSPDDLERASSASRQSLGRHRSADFQVEVARHELEVARTALRYSAAEGPSPGASTADVEDLVRIRSPVNGGVLRVYRESEGTAAAGEPLLEVGDPHALEVEVDVLSRDAVRIAPGTRVLFERWGGDHVLEGRVRVVEPVGFTKISALGVEEQRVFVVADLTSPQEEWSRLGDGYRVESVFILWEEDDVLKVPTSALFRVGDNWALFSVADDTAQLRKVEIGQRSGLETQILNGVGEGTVVIPHPSDAIEDGVTVEVRSEEAA